MLPPPAATPRFEIFVFTPCLVATHAMPRLLPLRRATAIAATPPAAAAFLSYTLHAAFYAATLALFIISINMNIDYSSLILHIHYRRIFSIFDFLSDLYLIASSCEKENIALMIVDRAGIETQGCHCTYLHFLQD
jgi:hypothetical protein